MSALSPPRRRFLRLLAWFGSLILLPRSAHPDDARLRQSLQELTGGAEPAYHPGVGLRMPSRAVSRLAVPVRVHCRLRHVDLIALLVRDHPVPLAARFNLSPRMRPSIRTHLRILKDSEVIAVVRADGRYFRQSARISVSEGCS